MLYRELSVQIQPHAVLSFCQKCHCMEHPSSILLTQSLASEVEERKYCIASLIQDHHLQTPSWYEKMRTQSWGDKRIPLLSVCFPPGLAGPGPCIQTESLLHQPSIGTGSEVTSFAGKGLHLIIISPAQAHYLQQTKLSSWIILGGRVIYSLGWENC